MAERYPEQLSGGQWFSYRRRQRHAHRAHAAALSHPSGTRAPPRGLDVTVTARHPQRWMETAFPYWEGDVTIADHYSGEAMGEDYLEMTRY